MSAFPCKHLAALLTLLLGYIGGRHHSHLIRGLYSLLFDAICIVFLMSLIRVSLCSLTGRFIGFIHSKICFLWVCLRV